MKLQKQLSRKVKGKSYSKYVVAIPPRHVEELGWKVGVELEAVVGANEVLLRPKSEQGPMGQKPIGNVFEEKTKRGK